MATTAMNKPKIEQGEEVEVEAEARTFSTQIPDDREALLEFMDQRAKSIQRLKDQISSLDRKVSSFFFIFFVFFVWLIRRCVLQILESVSLIVYFTESSVSPGFLVALLVSI
jgi:hypothetical protein